MTSGWPRFSVRIEPHPGREAEGIAPQSSFWNSSPPAATHLQEFFRKCDISVQRHQHPADRPAANESLSVRTLEKIAEDEEHQEAGSDTFYEQPEELAVRISQATFRWHPVESSLKLHDINLDIPRGRLTAIVGPVGCGKSSLLMPMLGQLDIQAGSLTWSSSASIQQLGYAIQRPCLMHASLRDNILFSSVTLRKNAGSVCPYSGFGVASEEGRHSDRIQRAERDRCRNLFRRHLNSRAPFPSL